MNLKSGSVVGVMMMMALAGCSSPGTTGKSNAAATAGDGGAGAASDGGAASSGAAATSALSCSAIVQCIQACAADDSACADACVAKGSPDGQAKVNALGGCIQTNACQDTSCVQSSCAAEVAACLDASSGTGTPVDPGSAPATGSVPATLQGQWASNGVLYDFKTDGTVSRLTDVSTAGCRSTKLENGVAVASGSSLEITFTSGLVKICGSASSDPYVAKKEGFTWVIDATGLNGADVLRLTTTTCAYPEPENAALYCTDSLDRK